MEPYAGREFAFLCYALERLSRRLDAVEQIATLEGQQSHDFLLTAGGRHRQSARREVYELPDPKAVPGHPAILELFELDLSGLLTATTLVILEHKANAVALVEDGNARCFQSAGVDKDVAATVGRRNETEALSGVVELQRTGSAHRQTFP